MEVVGIDNKDSEPLSKELVKKFNLIGNEALIFRTETIKECWKLFATYSHQKVSTMKMIYYAMNITGLNKKEIHQTQIRGNY